MSLFSVLDIHISFDIVLNFKKKKKKIKEKMIKSHNYDNTVSCRLARVVVSQSFRI